MPTLDLAKVRRWLRRAAPWLVLLAVVWVVLSNLEGRRLLRTGDPAPALETSLADGSRFVLAEHRGHVVVVNFWATWCAPCRAEAPVLSRIHRQLGASEGGMVVGISADGEPLDQVAPAARDLGMDYPIGVATGALLERYRVQMLPTTYVVAPDGTVVRSFVGAVNERELQGAIAEARGAS